MTKKLITARISVALVSSLILFSLPLSYAFGLDPSTIAKAITPDSGVISSSWTGPSKQTVIIFEENHISRVGQMEIALMLTRLYDRYHVNAIALEGALSKVGTIDTEWFHDLANREMREDVALQLLREGEISGVEFAALAMPAFNVHGVEEETEYNFTLQPNDDAAELVYLFAIAEKLFPQDNSKIVHANRLAEAFQNASEEEKPGKLKELMDYFISANPWTEKRYRVLVSEDKIYSTEDLVTCLEEIKSKALELNADVQQYSESFDRLIQFYTTASKRTDTMISNTLRVCEKTKSVPIPLIMGAAHTDRATELLRKKGVSYAVIQPIALKKGDKTGDLSMDAFSRKQKRLSVGDEKSIGAWLDGRWKPSPVLGENWLRSKSELYYITALLADTLAQGDHPPFDRLENEFSGFKYVRVDRKSFKVIGGELIFRADVLGNQANRWDSVWARTVLFPERKRKKSLEERLQEMLKEARDKGIKAEEKGGLEIVRVSRDSIAAYSRDAKLINKISISG